MEFHDVLVRVVLIAIIEKTCQNIPVTSIPRANAGMCRALQEQTALMVSELQGRHRGDGKRDEGAHKAQG